VSTIEQYPQNGYFLVADGATTELGSYVFSSDGDLALCQLRVFHKKPGPYSYQMRLVLSNKRGGPALHSSSWFEFSNAVTGQSDDNWLGDISFDFDGYNIIAGESYFFRVETTGYTRPVRPNENTAYLAFWSDWLSPVGTSNTAGARLCLGVKQ
jgi:hypothetical protein